MSQIGKVRCRNETVKMERTRNVYSCADFVGRAGNRRLYWPRNCSISYCRYYGIFVNSTKVLIETADKLYNKAVHMAQNDTIVIGAFRFVVLKRDGDFALLGWTCRQGIQQERWVNVSKKAA